MRVAIIVPIRSQKLFLKKTLGASQDLVRQMDSYLKALAPYDSYDIGKAVETVADGRWYDMSSHSFQTDIKRAVDWLADMTKAEYDSWFFDYITQLEDVWERVSQATTMAAQINARSLADAIEEHHLTWDADYEEGLHPKAVSLILGYADMLNKYSKVIAIQLARHKALKDKNPKVEKIETLYHASINARALSSKGFSLTMPDEAEGLGLGGSQNLKSGAKGISMTHDLGGALNIAKTFKELAMVANGQLTAKQILELVRREGDPKRFLRVLDYRGDYSTSLTFERGRFLAFKHEATREGPSKKNINPESLFPSAEDRADMYRAYIQTTSNRTDPFFMHIRSTMRNLKGKNPRNIGVVAVEVDMTNEDINYLGGEREFRVPPEAVIRVTKFIG